MGIVETVENLFPAPLAFDQTELAQNAQMLRNRRFGGSSNCREIAGAELLLQKAVDNFGATGITQRAENLGHFVRGIFVKERSACALNTLSAGPVELAAILGGRF
jgi:hypothetical protein